MGIFFVYILKSAICLALFYLFYRLLLSRETFHRFNRVALLGLLVLSCVVPLIEVGSEAVNVVNRQFFSWEEMLMMAELNSGVAAEVVETYSWREVLLLVYLVGIAFFFVRNLWSLGRMYGLIDGCKKRKLDDGVLLFIHQKTITPFSWMKCIVVSEKDYVESGETILTHERAHIANHHSWDLLLADLCVFFQWFNPAAWLLKQELQNIHEYEADEWVINQGIDAKKYQLLLIKKAVGTRLYSMANNLNHSNLKKRITMMIKKKSNPWACMKYLYILPLATIAVAAFARPEISNEFDEISSAKVSDLASFMKADGEKSLETPPVTSLAPQDSVFQAVEEMPEFPGGMKAMMQFIFSNVKYPAISQENGTQGRVITQFTVGKDGSITDAKVLRSVDPYLDKEALRVISAMPKWKPGKQGGKVVATRFTMPIDFRLPSDEPEERPVISAITLKVDGAVPEKPTLKIRGKEVSKILVDGKEVPIGDKEVSKILVDGKEVPIDEFVENHPAAIGSFAEGEIHSTDAADQVFEIVEEAPEFPGGMQAMMEYLAKNIRYPAKAHEANVQGRVITQFTVGKDGAIRDAKVVRSVSPELDAEALRVISAMPNWKPGKQGGKAVATRFTVPVVFRLTGDAPEEPTVVNAVGLKVDGNVPMGTVNDVKEYLRKGYRAQINYELGDKPSESKIAIRGSQNPLIVIDGVEKGVGADKLQAVNPQDVESIEILQPENAIAKFGDRAKEGAIIVTTKKGEHKETVEGATYDATLTYSHVKSVIVPKEGTSPLIIIDGEEKGNDQSILNQLDVQDIQTISVLKDESAVQQFGEKGREGVVIVTTKKASK
ncbi:MAG: TonB family protein [Mediterranea massiliensis]|nr:TonB family protein [Mediterranea massiliensis]